MSKFFCKQNSMWHMISKALSYFVTSHFCSWNYQFVIIIFVRTSKKLHGHYQSDYHLIHLADIRRSYLNYCQVYNMLNILHNRNHLKHYFLLQIFCYHQVGFFSTKSNAWTLSSGRLPEQDKQLEKFSYISVLAKYAKLPLEQNNPLLK